MLLFLVLISLQAKLDADQIDKLQNTVERTQRELTMVKKQHEEIQNQNQSLAHGKEQIVKDLQEKTKQYTHIMVSYDHF